MAMRSQGIPLINVIAERLAWILDLPEPDQLVTVSLSEADFSRLSAEIVSLFASQLQLVGNLVERLGAAGDVLGALNDQAP